MGMNRIDAGIGVYLCYDRRELDGKLSGISFSKLSNLTVQGYPNPQMSIKNSIWDNNKSWIVNFTIMQDIKRINYLVSEDKHSIDLDYTYEECLIMY